MIARQNVTEVLAERGVPAEEIAQWLEDGETAEYLYRMARNSAMARVPEVWRRLELLTAEGDVRAIKTYCELCERGRPAVPQGESGMGEAPEIAAVRTAVFGDGE